MSYLESVLAEQGLEVDIGRAAPATQNVQTPGRAALATQNVQAPGRAALATQKTRFSAPRLGAGTGDEKHDRLFYGAAVRARFAEIARMFPGARVFAGGSFAKGTAIAAAFDLDVVVYFPHGWAAGPREIYQSAEERLRGAGHTVVRHGVALRLQYTPGWHVDVVPGRALDDAGEYANLWHSERGGTRKTSLQRHIELARAGDRDVVRLLKLWRLRSGAPVGSFVLELAAARAAGGGGLEERLERVLRFLCGIEEARLVDPANSGNVVSEDIEWGRKRAVAELAERALGERWERVVW